MSLNGGIFVPTNKDKKEVQINSGKSFKIGNSLDCDWILRGIENGGPFCIELCIDNFGRVSGSNAFGQGLCQNLFDFQVTIRNCLKEESVWPLKVNGVEIKKSTRLLNGQKIQILQDEYVWKFDTTSLNTHRRQEETLQATPPKADMTEENAYSEPSLRVSWI